MAVDQPPAFILPACLVDIQHPCDCGVSLRVQGKSETCLVRGAHLRGNGVPVDGKHTGRAARARIRLLQIPLKLADRAVRHAIETGKAHESAPKTLLHRSAEGKIHRPARRLAHKAHTQAQPVLSLPFVQQFRKSREVVKAHFLDRRDAPCVEHCHVLPEKRLDLLPVPEKSRMVGNVLRVDAFPLRGPAGKKAVDIDKAGRNGFVPKLQRLGFRAVHPCGRRAVPDVQNMPAAYGDIA